MILTSPAIILHQVLLDLSLGTNDPALWPVFVSFLPELPDQAICMYDTAGTLDGRLMSTGERIDHFGIMIRVRSQLYPVAWEKVNEIALALDSVKRLSVAVSSEEFYVLHNVSRSGSIMSLGVEDEGSRRRYDFTLNAVVTITKQE